MRIIVTGGGGFIGSHSAELLSKRGHQVLVIDNFSTGRSENLSRFKGKLQVADITDMRCLEPIFYEFQPEAVLHLAAQSAITTSLQNPQKDMEVNGIGTLNLLQLSIAHEVKRFVFASTSAVYCNNFKSAMKETDRCFPKSPYGISKLAAEHYVRSMFPNHCILRYANVYGPRQLPIGENQVIARIFRHLIFQEDFEVFGHGCQKRDFVYVDDIAYCNFLSLMGEVVGTFNACFGKSIMINQLVHEVGNVFGLPGDYLWQHTVHNDPRGDVRMDNSLIRKELGWSASVPLRDGLERTMEWWKGQK